MRCARRGGSSGPAVSCASSTLGRRRMSWPGLISLVFRRLERTADNIAGRLPEMFRQAGFVTGEQTEQRMTILGTLSLYRDRNRVVQSLMLKGASDDKRSRVRHGRRSQAGRWPVRLPGADVLLLLGWLQEGIRQGAGQICR